MLTEMKGYSSEQSYRVVGAWEQWLVLLDTYNAIEFGFDKYRLPMPGKDINVQESLDKVKSIQREWYKEWALRDGPNSYYNSDPLYSGPPAFTEMSINAQLSLATQIKAAKSLSQREVDNAY